MVPWNSVSGGFAYIWRSKWLGIIATKTERTQIHFFSNVLVTVASLDLKVAIREFTQRQRRRQRERQKTNRFRHDKQNNNFARASRLFVHFSAVAARLQREISRFVEDGNKREQLSFSFPELWCSPLVCNSKTICQHLTN